MKLILWNVEWAASRFRTEAILSVIRTEEPNLICLTEVTLKPEFQFPNVIKSELNTGYRNPGDRYKVWMWSDSPWSEVDRIGSKDLSCGRFVSGVTQDIRFVGVCVPWADAHVHGGNKNRVKWEDHLLYLKALGTLLEQYCRSEYPVCVLGDFNQRVPPTGRNQHVYGDLASTLEPFCKVQTADVMDVDGKHLIDHVATTDELSFSLDRTISRHKANEGRISDHPGLVGTLSRNQPIL